jgi:Zn-dependent protease/CBS domain-containing protein
VWGRAHVVEHGAQAREPNGCWDESDLRDGGSKFYDNEMDGKFPEETMSATGPNEINDRVNDRIATTPPDGRPSSGIRIGNIFGIPIFLHASWFIIFALITLSLRTQFTSQHPSWSPQQHWALGIITSALFFGSVVFHELSHSIVAMRYKIPVQSITLFVFGGLSSISREPEKPKQEFNIAIAGPLSSLFLAGCFYLVAHFFHGDDMVAASSKWLWEINLALAIFNLVPGFPLDGGRILRGIAWGITGNFQRATRIASITGKVFAYAMIIFGAWQAMTGNWIGGIWTAFIGWFLLSAAQESYAQVAVQNTLMGVRTGDVMTREVPTVTRDMSIDEYVHEVLRTGARFHLVTGAGNPVGLISLDAARTVPKDEWTNTSIQAVMLPIDRMHSAEPDEPVLAVLQRMKGNNIHQMPVVSDGHIVGMVGLDDIVRVLQTRIHVGSLAGH